MKGPVVNNAFGSEMRVIDYNHCCVKSVSDDSIEVFRETIGDTTWVKTEQFNFNRTTKVLIEMLDFIKYHVKLATEEDSYNQAQMNLHRLSIEKLENELNARNILNDELTEFILLRLIKDKEEELVLLKTQLSELKCRVGV